MDKNRIEALFDACRGKRIAIVGDLMVDRYFWGEIERISPEAPVPVVEVTEESYNFGGAANVAHNLLNLGAIPVPFGVVGKDQVGAEFTEKLKGASIETEYIFVDPKRPTTVKSRVIARNQHVVRLDRESRSDIPAEIEEEIIGGFSLAAGDFQAVIFQDYNKGVATPKIISAIIDICRRKDIFVAVDPKFHNFFQYRRVNLFKPNVKETEAALVAKIHTEADLLECGKRIFHLLEPDHLLITMGSKGSALFQNKEEKPINLSTIARQVHDVSGAGDTVIATIVAFYAAGASLYEAAVISNYAAGTVCEEVGVVAVNREKLKKALLSE